MRKYLIQLTAALAMLGWLNISPAAEPAMEQGRIDAINLKTGQVVIDDRARYLGPGYSVKNIKGEVISAFSLKKGQTIQYKMDGRKLKEIIIVR